MSFIARAERTPVTTILCVGSVAAFAAASSGRSIEHLAMEPYRFLSEPWLLLSTIFPHGGILHLLFNLLWTWQLGGEIESRVGLGKMLLLTVCFSFASSAAQVAVGDGGIGLSGVVYGFAFYLYARGKHDPRFRGIVDDRLRNFFIAWFFVCILLTRTGALPIANAAHGVGGLTGFFWGVKRWRWAGPIVLGLALVAATMSATLFPQPRWSTRAINLEYNAGTESLEERRYQDAIDILESVVAKDPKFGAAWWNLGIAYGMKGRTLDEAAAKERAREVDPAIARNHGRSD